MSTKYRPLRADVAPRQWKMHLHRSNYLMSLVKATHLFDSDHLGPILRLDGARVGTVLLQGKMGPRPMVVFSIRGQYPPQVAFIEDVEDVEDDDVVEALAPDRSDDTLDVRLLPR